MFLLCVVLMLGYLFYDKPRELGREQFTTALERAARSYQSDAATEGDLAAQSSRLQAIEELQKSHQHVRVSLGGPSGSTQHCGWLVLQNGEDMLLLTRVGPLLISAAGEGFSWSTAPLNEC